MAVRKTLAQNADTGGDGHMQSLSGTMWRVTEARAFDEAGHKLLPLGSHPIGFVIFEAKRMLVAVGDGRTSLPSSDGPRFFVAYTGSYKFDGAKLITWVDDASKPELIVKQVRRIRFESETRMVAVPVSGLPGQSGIEVVWERVS
jgi:Lipocalin-like domain